VYGHLVSLASFNAATAGEAEAAMLSCCESRTLATRVAAGRPYASAQALQAAISAAFNSLTWDDVLEGMAGHPRIGGRVTGASASEQSGVTDDSQGPLIAGNVAYEERFGHVFLICASGLTGQEMLIALRERLSNTPDAERVVATSELLKITLLRARKLAGS
jgi:2-oxo-4-hydroxy-4-carboxy-5-ureidoimidazoline decarboxylase